MVDSIHKIRYNLKKQNEGRHLFYIEQKSLKKKKVCVVLAEVFKMETFLSRVLKSLSYEDVCVT